MRTTISANPKISLNHSIGVIPYVKELFAIVLILTPLEVYNLSLTGERKKLKLKIGQLKLLGYGDCPSCF